MRYRTIASLLILGMMLVCQPAFAQKAKTGKASAPRAARVEESASNPRAQEILGKMCDFLKSQQQFSFKAEVTTDRPSVQAGIIQASFDIEAYVRRPDRLRIDGEGDLVSKQFYFDGKTITLYDKTHNVYATEEVPPDIEGALEKAHREFHLRVALADLASERLCDHVSKNLTNATYEGLHKVRGILCHLLTFERNKVRFQVWIEDGDKPLIRKVVITHDALPHSPQWSAFLTDWNLAPQLEDSLFAYTPAQGAEKIEFVRGQPAAQAPKAKPGAAKKQGGKQ